MAVRASSQAEGIPLLRAEMQKVTQALTTCDAQYKQCFGDDYLAGTFGALPIASITADDVRDWYAATLADKPAESLVATILHGRPGTAMPPWRGLLTEQEAQWIVERLQAGFPQD